ncbi:MAG: hypothetical protein WCH99_16955 [Verrucomicrobiota bacterium]
MKQPEPQPASTADKPVSEILILPGGKILVHNLTPVMAVVLAELNPEDQAMNRRALRKKS